MNSFNIEWRSVLTALKLQVVQAMHGDADGPALQLASDKFIAFASANEGILNNNPLAMNVAKAFMGFASSDFAKLPPEQMLARLSRLSECLDAAIVDTVRDAHNDTTAAPERLAVSEKAIEQRPGIFLSHSHHDKPFVRRLAHDLLRSGARVWIDEAEMLVGDSLIEKIREGIDAMDYVGAVISRHSVASAWVRRELDVAMNQEIEGRRVKVLPLLLDDCALPGFLMGKLFADFRDPKSYGDALNQVRKRLSVGELLITKPSTDVRPPNGSLLDQLLTLKTLGRSLHTSGNAQRFLDQIVSLSNFLRLHAENVQQSTALQSLVSAINEIVRVRDAIQANPDDMSSPLATLQETIQAFLSAADQLIVESLCQGLRASYPGDREKAARALGRLGRQAASGVVTLRKALKDPSGPVRVAAVWALAEIGTEEARQAVHEYESR